CRSRSSRTSPSAATARCCSTTADAREEPRMTDAPPPPNGESIRLEPLTDFSKEPARAAMREALAQLGRQLGSTHPPVIADKPVPTAATFDSLNPSHKRQVVGRVGKSPPEVARQAIDAAAAAYPGWRDTDVAERARRLHDAAAV